MRRQHAVATSVVVAVLAAFAGPAVEGAAESPGTAPTAMRPNIVVIMVDDLSSDLVRYMDEVADLQSDGVSFRNYFVSNSLCCPSRATYLTGKYPHNSKVTGNFWPEGGFRRFLKHDIETSIAPYLSAAGYRTGLIGKYLNEYNPQGADAEGGAPGYPAAYVPPGWDEFFGVGGNGYQHFHYEVVDGVDGEPSILKFTGNAEENYLTDVISARTKEFLGRAAAGREPFFLTLAPFAVHGGGGGDPQRPDSPRFPPAPRDRADSPNRPAGWGEPRFEGGDCGLPLDGGCDDVAFPDPSWGSFNQPITDPADHSPTEPLPPETLDKYEMHHTERVQMAQAVNDLIGDVRAELASAGLAGNTYIVFTSDNGFHLGEHALESGKAMPYDHDVRVPLVIRQPGGSAPGTRTKIAQNTDLLPTLLDIANATVPSDLDGKSLLPIVENAPTGKWRRTALLEYFGPHSGKQVPFNVDPDRETGKTHTPVYVGLRTRKYLYVDYSRLDSTPARTGHAEYFDLRKDPHMLHNTFDDLRHGRKVKLNDAALRYDSCAGRDCWEAGLAAP